MLSNSIARPGQRIALRMDDVGASSKKYEIYSRHSWKFGNMRISANWLFLKYLAPYKAWGPYRELNATEWNMILELLSLYHARLTLAVTASWVDSKERLIPFPEKFPAEANVIKMGVERGMLEVANHGLTHSIIENNAFKPKLFAGNREFHREFGSQVNNTVQNDHIRRSQSILREWLDRDVVTFVPPGNQFTEATLEAARRHGLRFVSCETEERYDFNPIVLGNRNVVAFHDRDIVINGVNWFRDLLDKQKRNKLVFVRDLVEFVDHHGH